MSIGLPPAAGHYEIGQTPTIKEAQAIADEIFADFVSEEVDKVELVYTKFVSLISSGECRLRAGSGLAQGWLRAGERSSEGRLVST